MLPRGDEDLRGEGARRTLWGMVAAGATAAIAVAVISLYLGAH